MSRKINFLGIEFDVVSEDEQRDPLPGTLYGVMRVVDSDPRAGSPALRARRYTINCDDCRELCWLDPVSFGPTPDWVPKVCLHCMKIRTDKGSGSGSESVG